MTYEKAIDNVKWHFKTYHGKSIDDYEITNIPGYWRAKEPCGGKHKCRAPIHGFMFNEGPTKHTLYYAEPGLRDSKGRFISQFRAWKLIKEHETN